MMGQPGHQQKDTIAIDCGTELEKQIILYDGGYEQAQLTSVFSASYLEDSTTLFFNEFLNLWYDD